MKSLRQWVTKTNHINLSLDYNPHDVEESIIIDWDDTVIELIEDREKRVKKGEFKDITVYIFFDLDFHCYHNVSKNPNRRKGKVGVRKFIKKWCIEEGWDYTYKRNVNMSMDNKLDKSVQLVVLKPRKPWYENISVISWSIVMPDYTWNNTEDPMLEKYNEIS